MPISLPTVSWLRRSQSKPTTKKPTRPIKVLHAPLNFANQAYVLSQALRAQGIDSHLLRYQWEENTAVRFYQEEDRVATISRRDWLGDMLRNVQDIAHEGFDIVHFWNRSLLWRRPTDFFNGMDLPYIRLAGPRIVYRFTGYELRRRSLEMQVNPFSPYRYGFKSPFDEDNQKRYLESISPYIDMFVVQDPEMQSYCPHACIIPRAVDLQQFPVPEPIRNERPLVVHAPSRRDLKGTDFIVKAVETLKEEGLDFDFRMIENMPHAEALAQYRRADIVIDQLLVGWYGVLTMEAMAMGKTAIVYIRNDLTGYFRDGMPMINANPDTITAALRDAVKDGELRQEIGRRARAFVEKTHDSRAVARMAAGMYEGVLKMPASPLLPNFSFQLGRSIDFRKGLLSRSDVESLRERMAKADEEIRLLRAAQSKAEELRPDPPSDDPNASQSSAIRQDARRYRELKAELPALRYKAKRYDELKDVALVWHAKADRFDRLTSRRWLKLLARFLGISLTSKPQANGTPPERAETPDAEALGTRQSRAGRVI